MAVTPLGNIIFVNQNMHVAAAAQQNQNIRYDAQNVAAQAAVNESEKAVDETRPPEELHAVDPDREHEKEEADQEQKEQTPEHFEKQDEAQKKETDSNGGHRLDIRV